jgi:hypothetical protein
MVDTKDLLATRDRLWPEVLRIFERFKWTWHQPIPTEIEISHLRGALLQHILDTLDQYEGSLDDMTVSEGNRKRANEFAFRIATLSPNLGLKQ